MMFSEDLTSVLQDRLLGDATAGIQHTLGDEREDVCSKFPRQTEQPVFTTWHDVVEALAHFEKRGFHKEKKQWTQTFKAWE